MVDAFYDELSVLVMDSDVERRVNTIPRSANIEFFEFSAILVDSVHSLYVGVMICSSVSAFCAALWWGQGGQVRI